MHGLNSMCMFLKQNLTVVWMGGGGGIRWPESSSPSPGAYLGSLEGGGGAARSAKLANKPNKRATELLYSLGLPV